MLKWDEKWPYKQLDKQDSEQALIKDDIAECCVASIDILGFKSMVSGNIDSVILALRYIKLFRDSFYSLPSRRGNPSYDSYVRDVSDEDDEEPELPKATMFSDSIVISQRLDRLSSFSDFVEFIAQMQFELLTAGILTRGGLDIGKLYHDDSFIFGDGLVSAYSLENTNAIFPRIVVSEKAMERIKREEEERFQNEYKQSFLQNGKRYYLTPNDLDNYFYKDEFFYITTEDERYIDFFKLGLIVLQASSPEYFDMGIKLANAFYEDTLSRIIQVIKAGLDNENEGVREKFEWLKKSYNRNIKIYLRTYVNRFKNKDKETALLTEWSDRFLIQ